MKKIKKQLKISEIHLSKPCEVDWYGMEPLPDGNRFCHQCNKVVHDLGDKDDAYLNALIEEKGREICVNFYTSQLSPGPERLFAKRNKTFPWAAKAASLAMLLSMAQVPAKGEMPDGPKTELSGPSKRAWNPDRLLTGTIESGDGKSVDIDLKVSVLSEGVQIKSFEARSGLFMADLSGLPIRGDSIELVLHPAIKNSKRYRWIVRSSRIKVPLSAMQNVVFVADTNWEKKFRINLHRRRAHRSGGYF